FGNQEAVVCIPQQRRLTYQQLSEAVDHLAKGLMAIGYKKGDRIGIWSTNNIEWLLLQMATARLGIILVNINPALLGKELAYAIQRSQLQGLFLIPGFRKTDYVARLMELMPELKNTHADKIHLTDFPDLRQLVIFDPKSPEQTASPYPGLTPWQEILAAGANLSNEQLDEATDSLDFDDAINIQYTSGTTGFPKPVVLSHHNLLNNAYFTAQEMQFNETDRLCVPVPFYHCFGMVLANLLCFSVGACVVIPSEHFDAQSVLQAIEQEKCTAIHGVPTMFIAELEHAEFNQYDYSSLRSGIMAGAPCPPELMTRVIVEMHCSDILIGYGETEASPLTHITSHDDSFERRIHTVGKNLPHQEVKIIDTDTGHIQPIGEVGEICFRGYHVMIEYFNDAENTAKTVDKNGWLFSGDLGTMDEEGYVKITGRRKEMIIRGGENLYPAEIEGVIFQHAKVEQVAVFGVPDKFYGEEVMAWILPRHNETLSEAEIRQYCQENLAHFKVPKYICIVEEFPMTVTGKLQKFKMREMAIKQLEESQ
ncbi:MAG TPA: AMP-binding protein, partial [Gammaproteobacteria bacterium]|nr:AMP-binding protein [Gammaproteobacteria bacterium]